MEKILANLLRIDFGGLYFDELMPRRIDTRTIISFWRLKFWCFMCNPPNSPKFCPPKFLAVRYDFISVLAFGWNKIKISMDHGTCCSLQHSKAFENEAIHHPAWLGVAVLCYNLLFHLLYMCEILHNFL